MVQRSVLAGLVLLSLLTIPAHAAGCPAAGGEHIPNMPVSDGSNFVFTGGGWGHGVGMSQYGLQGGARLGCTAEQMLATYYTGTTVADLASDDPIRVGLYPWGPPGSSGDGFVSSYSVSNVGTKSIRLLVYDGQAQVADHALPEGTTWTLRRTGGVWRFLVDEEPVKPDVAGDRIVAKLTNRQLRIPAKNRVYARGTLHMQAVTDGRFRVLVELPNLDEYLYGLAEVPSSWPAQALRAQAIAGRSYAAIAQGSIKDNCDCHLYDSTFDQVYRGLGPEVPSWVAAVDSSHGLVLSRDGKVVTGHYSSSSGGHTANISDIWGGSVSHEVGVDDSAWDLASDNPYRTWRRVISPAFLGDVAGVGVATSATIVEAAPSGHAVQVKVTGSEGTSTVSGTELRWGLGLRSTRFTILDPSEAPPSPPPLPAVPDEAQPITGMFSGDREGVGWFHEGQWWLNFGDGRVEHLHFGTAGDRPVVGDWDNDGVDTIGIVRNASWRLVNTIGQPTADVIFSFGMPGDHPLVGDWDGDGQDGPGVVRGNAWYLRNSLTGGAADHVFAYGAETDRPVAGDWDRDGDETPGLIRGRRLLLRNVLDGGFADEKHAFGNDTDFRVTGDWDGSGDATLGVVRDSSWRLQRNLGDATAAKIIEFRP